MYKTIKCDIFPPIDNVVQAMHTTLETVTQILSKRFPSEHNQNTLDYAHDVLDGYCYVPIRYKLWEGRYVRYLDMKDTFHMNLKLGGFVINDNKYTVTLKNDKHVFKVNKRNRLWFMTIHESDLRLSSMRTL